MAEIDFFKLALPELISVCPMCKGQGAYVQRYLEGRFPGPCGLCRGTRFLYTTSGRPAPKSVRAQIETRNGVAFDRVDLMREP